MNNVFLCFGLPFLIASLYFGGQYWKERRFGQRLQREGQSAAALIVTRSTQSSGRGGTFCFVTFQYETPLDDKAVTQTQQQQISIKAYKRISEGEQVTVRYLPDNPAVSRLDGEYWDRSKATNQLALFGFFGAMSLLFLAAMLRG